jgi:hypothetical protein
MITRRALLTALAAAAAGGPHRRQDDAMASNSWSNQTTTRVVIVEGTPYSGLFFYSPAPGPGNLVGSWTAAAGTDPYGNAYPAGIYLVNIDSTGTLNIPLTNTLGQSPIIELDTGLGLSSIPPSIYGRGEQGDQVDALILRGPTAIGDADASSILIGILGGTAVADTATLIMQFSDSGGAVSLLLANDQGVNIGAGMITAPQPGGGAGSQLAPETWHTPVYESGAGWAGGPTSGSFQPLQYRLQPDGLIALIGICHNAGAAGAGSTILVLPPGYLPSIGQRVPCTINSGGTLSANGLEIETGGQVNLMASISGGDVIVDALFRIT